MLRALASYFFGGIEDEMPEAPLECETREVNDWLVVNLPDQAKDNINLNEDDDTYEIDDDDIRNEEDDGDDTVEVDATDTYEMDTEEDDILLSLSFLMMPQGSRKPSLEFSSDQYSFDNSVSEQYPNLYPTVFTTKDLMEYFAEDVSNHKLMHVEGISDPIIEFVFPVQQAIQGPNKMDDDTRDVFLDLILDERVQKRAHRNEIVSEFGGVHVHTIDITPPPMYSKSYVNHRHPEKLLNHGKILNILQRIKELEPEQQAVQRSAKKILTRGQLNRQNKNYMYETSSKRNRRSNRQRNHSGANNNRKC